MRSEHSAVRFAAALAAAILAGLWSDPAKGGEFGGKSQSNPSGFRPAIPSPSRGRFQQITVPRRSAYPTMGRDRALVTIRIFAPAPNAWNLARRLADPRSILDRLPGAAKIEFRPCARDMASILAAIQSMVGWHRRQTTAERVWSVHGWRRRPSTMSHFRAKATFSNPLRILSSNVDAQTRAEYASALVQVIESTHLLLSLGRSCARSQPVTILIGGHILSVPRFSTKRQILEQIVTAYQEEIVEARKALRNGLPRYMLARWQINRALTSAMASGHPSTNEARGVLTLLTTPPKRPVVVEGGIPISDSRKSSRRRIDLFIPLNRAKDLTRVGLVLVLAEAFADDLRVVLHPMESRMRPRASTPARFLTAAFLTGNLPSYLERLFRSAGSAASRLRFLRDLGPSRTKRLLETAGSSKVTEMLKRDIRRIAALGHLPTDAVLVIDGRIVPFSTSNTMPGLLAVSTSVQGGLVGRLRRSLVSTDSRRSRPQSRTAR